MDDPRAKTRKPLLETLEERPSRYPLLTTLSRLLEQGTAMDAETLTTVASHLGRDEDSVRALAEFLDAVVAAPAGGECLHVCHGLTCSSRGSVALHARIIPDLRAAGMAVDMVPVHCLNQCERGPTLGFADRFYLGHDEVVISDERPWRQRPFALESD
ncbi:MAG: NAD(P)H-dependent oxidoreductase subunit E [Planctomycetes bacterium]|nr:NAD(P)H-dependent oxidoreductase subunit E [Planctomycetota bacterium]